MTLEELRQFTYSRDEVNDWLQSVDCQLVVKRSEDGTHLEVWDESPSNEWDGSGQMPKPVLHARMYMHEGACETGFLREIVYSSGVMMALVRSLFENAKKGECFPYGLTDDYWYVLCSFMTPEAAWSLVHGNKEVA